MTEARKKVTVRIMDKDYTLRASDDPDYLRALAAYVDGKIRGIARGAVGAPLVDVAILAAVNIADELHRSRRSSAQPSAGAASARKSGGGSGGDEARWVEVHERLQALLDRLPK